jgi:hypothetical protein
MGEAYKKWKENIRKNIKYVNQKQTKKPTMFRHTNVPAYIIGAGPSLKRNYKELENIENGIVIAQNASAQYVKKPDYFTAVDYEGRDHWWKDVDFSETMGIFSLKITPDIHKLNFKDKVFMLPTGNDQFCNLHTKHPKLDMVDHGDHTTYSAYHLAYLMGCNPIIFVGCDYAYTDNQMHIDEDLTPDTVECDHNADMKQDFPKCRKCKSVYDKKHDIWSLDGLSYCQQLTPKLNRDKADLSKYDFLHAQRILHDHAFVDGIPYGNLEYAIQMGLDGRYVYSNRVYGGAVSAMVCQSYFVSQQRQVINATERGLFFENGFFNEVTQKNIKIQEQIRRIHKDAIFQNPITGKRKPEIGTFMLGSLINQLNKQKFRVGRKVDY